MDAQIDNTTPNEDIAAKLLEIYTALKEVEKLRFSDNLEKDERLEMERASVELRGEERKLVKNITAEVVAQIKQSSLSMDQLAREVRIRSTKLSKASKGVDKITKAIIAIVDIVSRINKQLNN